ncbi:MAG: prolipoprotein diacylglyceryl transferase [Lentisphaeria bacterium]|nr:prolipoprotein diacylglyceryl transferase [Lentisphaeria bacterium]
MFPYIDLFGNKLGMFPLCTGIALLAITLSVRFQLKKISQEPDLENKIMIAIPLSMLSGVFTAYLSDVIFRGGWKALTMPWGFGLTFYGWLTGCIIFYLVYGKVCRIKPSLLFDLFLPAFSLAQALGRIGCFCGGCCYGLPSACLGVEFPPGSLPYQRYGNTPLIPVQLIESVSLLAIFLILFQKVPFHKRAAWYLILMPAERFLLEFLRGDNRGDIGGFHQLSPAQMLSVVFLFAGVISLYGKRQRHNTALP